MNRFVQSAATYAAAKTFDSLDQQGVAAAFSVRRLFESYTGPILTVRRAFDNAERDFSFDHTGFLDTAALTAWVTGVDSDGDAYVSRWYDQSGHGNHAEMSVSFMQPQIVNYGAVMTRGGKPVVDFDTSWRSMLTLTAFTAINAVNQPMATFTVQHMHSNNNTYDVVFDARNSGRADMFTAPFHQYNTSEQGRRYTNVNRQAFGDYKHLETEHDFPTEQALASYVFNGTNGRVYIDGTAIGVETDQRLLWAPAFTNATIGGVIEDATHHPMFSGGIQEVVIYNADKTPMRTVIEASIKHAYDL